MNIFIYYEMAAEVNKRAIEYITVLLMLTIVVIIIGSSFTKVLVMLVNIVTSGSSVVCLLDRY